MLLASTTFLIVFIADVNPTVACTIDSTADTITTVLSTAATVLDDLSEPDGSCFLLCLSRQILSG